MMQFAVIDTVPSSLGAILSDTVGIRRFERADESALYDAVRESLPELTSWMVWCNPDYSREDAAAFLARHDELWQARERYDLAIFHRPKGALLGSVGLSQLDWQNRTANIGYWVRTKSHNQGVGRTAIRFAAHFAFEALGLTRLEFVIQTSNIASLHAARRAGAVQEGILRNRLVLRGKTYDAVVLSLIPECLDREDRSATRADLCASNDSMRAM
jgi:RimJ/RimL family protein N-acetyltransferase